MRRLIAGLITLHGLSHLPGPVKAFGWADLPQLTEPISRPMGLVWLVASVGMCASAALLARDARGWSVTALVAVALSQAAIAASWEDAWAGTIPNLVIFVAALYGLAAEGPWSLRAEYRRRARSRMGVSTTREEITESDLAELPRPVQDYLRLTGALGQERVRHFRALWRGRIRSSPGDPWMEFSAEQYNEVDPPARFFLMDARRGGLPVDVFHAFEDEHATMRVRLLSVFPLVDARGVDMDRAETVTFFNDMCLLAPWVLVDVDVRWEAIDARSVRGRFTLGPNTVSAVLYFNDAGELVDFVSDDRLAAAPDGKSFERLRWSTPLAGYRWFGPLRVMSRGQGLWHPPEGAFAYFEGELVEVEMNPTDGPVRGAARFRRATSGG
jgi:hypothetical protein